MTETPRSNRYHIAVFGRRNVGKSSLVNCLAGQSVSIVSDVAGTTTDTVWKNIELPGIGAAVIGDTAGFDDVGTLGAMPVGFCSVPTLLLFCLATPMMLHLRRSGMRVSLHDICRSFLP